MRPSQGADAPVELEGADRQLVLSLLFSHRMSWVQEYLRALPTPLPFSGTKEDLQARVEGYLASGDLTDADLITLLDAVEGWGNQHIYLYKARPELITALSDEPLLKKQLRKLGVLHLLNARIPLVLPDQPTLTTVEWSQERFRLVWVEKRSWRERIQAQDREEGDFEFDAYRKRDSRAIISFSCDLLSANAELMIQRLPSGNDYVTQKKRYERLLAAFIDTASLRAFHISPAIKKVDENPKIRKRQSQLLPQFGGRVTFTSRSRSEDVYQDPEFKAARKAFGTNTAGRLGNLYWPLQQPDETLHVKLYAKDQRIGIFGECTEGDVRFVLSGIRTHCR